jgi:omega-3 fatty acid desaturase (delta-15 desaturase)
MTSAPLPFSRRQLQEAIPARCFEPRTGLSLAYLAFDLTVIAALHFALLRLDAPLLRPLFWFALGTLYWSLFMIGHDCGHKAFSRREWVNTLVGYLTHSALLVPYRGWQNSHALHHQWTGCYEREEAFDTLKVEAIRRMNPMLRMIRYDLLPLILPLGFPLYLLGLRNKRHAHLLRSSHFLPTSDLFAPEQRWRALVSTACVLAFLSGYGALGFLRGVSAAWDHVFAPLLVCYGWLGFVTYLQHNDPDVLTYEEKTWNPLLGALATVDRSYGWANWITHHIGDHHVVHHLFPTIPHYRLKEATRAIEPILGPHLRRRTGSVWKAFFRSYRACRGVEGEGVLHHAH